jgi:hypothetical protein
MVASVQLALASTTDVAMQTVPPQPPSKVTVAKFETALHKPEGPQEAGLQGHRAGQAVHTEPGIGEKLVDVTNKFNTDYKNVFQRDLQKMMDADPNDPFQVIRGAEFAISMQQANLQFTMVAGIADSSKKSLHELLKNQG